MALNVQSCFLVVIVVSLTLVLEAAKTHYEHKPRYSCGACEDIIDALSLGDRDACSRYGTFCHDYSDWFMGQNQSTSQMKCDQLCGTSSSRSNPSNQVAQNSWADVRVSVGFGGTKPYGVVRVSVVTPDDAATPSLSIEGKPSDFEYSSPFVYKWLDNALHTTQIEMTDKSPIEVTINEANMKVSMPPLGTGVAGVLIADPCLSYGSIISLVACEYAKKFQTTERTSQLLNAFVGASPETSFWGILGDNFYDRTGETTKVFFSRLNVTTLQKPFITVPGNHDYWVLGAPAVGTKNDQYSNGFIQYYGQDTKAAEALIPGQPGINGPPYNFSVKPDKKGGSPENLPAIQNSFLYHQIGNLGVVGFSGAYSLEETRPLMTEACAWLGKQAASGTLKLAMLLGHWDTSGVGASSEMAVPGFYDEMKVIPGCDILDQKDALKFFMGHTHCNIPHPHGHINTGFMVAGQGMEGCGNYGVPIVDTTDDRIRVWYFEVANKTGYDHFDATMDCLKTRGGWRNCTQFATTWLDQPMPTF